MVDSLTGLRYQSGIIWISLYFKEKTDGGLDGFHKDEDNPIKDDKHSCFADWGTIVRCENAQKEF